MPGRSESHADLRAESVRSMGRGTTITIVGTIALFGLSFLGRVTAARELSIADWGIYNLGISLTGLLAIVSLLGLSQATARSLAAEGDPSEQRAVARWAVALATAIGVLTSLAVYFLAGPLARLFSEPALAPVFEILSVTVGFSVFASVLAATFQGFRDAFPNAVFNQALNPALFVVLVLTFFVLHAGLDGVLWATVGSTGGAFFGLLLYTGLKLRRHLAWRGPAAPRPRRELWDLTLALWGVSSLAYITAFADTLVLGIYWPATTVGFYSAAMSLARLVLLAGATVTYIYLPVATRLEQRGANAEMRSIYVTATRWMLLLTMPFFLLFVFAPELTIESVFGSGYGPGGAALAILALSAFVSSAVGPVNATLTGLAYARIQLATAAVSAIVNVALSFLLIPRWGLLGAAAAWGIARALYPTLGLLAIYSERRLHPFQWVLVKPMAVALAVGGPLFYGMGHAHLPHYFVVPIYFLGAGIFLAALVLTRAIVPDDLVAIDAIERLVHRPMPRVRGWLVRHQAGPSPPA
ncbi:MAG: oligosaccharide flippase family protein [Thermoplasmata archaeon]